jgi:transposase-like protein
MTDVISHKRFQDEEAAYEWVEAHLWPHGPECPRCHGRERITKLQGKSTRIGTYKCKDCRKPFTVKIGTIFEDSHIPMRMWLQAIVLLCASKKGISSNQLHRMLGVTLKSAWFMSHRIREAMRAGGLAPPMGGSGGVVEADETFIGRNQFPIMRGGYSHKHAVLTLVERGGEARSFHIERADRASIIPVIRANIAKEAKVATDEAGYYRKLRAEGYDHQSVRHKNDEWVRGAVHTNTAENYFSIFKRGMRGTYQHCSEKHLHRYLADFDFRYNGRVALGVDDEQRAAKALQGAKGKRLTYRTTGRARPGTRTATP